MRPARSAPRQPGPHRALRLLWFIALLAGAATATVVPPTGPAFATGSAMSPDTVTQIEDPGVTLAVPADGRVDGYQFAAKVLGAATGSSMPGPNGERAGVGQRLWVFGLRWLADQTLDGTGQPNGLARITATLIYGGARLVVPVQPIQPSSGTQPVDSGDEYFLASLPAASKDVELELANGGFVQDFSLTHMARAGTQPAVLYRNPNSWQVTQPLTLSQSLPTPYTQSANVDTSSLLSASITLQLAGVTLSYFAPDGPTDIAADPSHAWLIPDLEDPLPKFNSAFQNLNYTTHAQASGITLTLPDGSVVTAKDFPGTGPDSSTYSGDDNNTVFPDDFAFQVPADFTSGTITVALPSEVAYPDYGFTAPSQTYKLAPVHFPVSVPPATAIAPAPGASTRPALIRAATSSAVSSAGGKGSGSTILVIVIVLLGAAALTGSAVGLRRRHLSHAATPHATQPEDTGGAVPGPISQPASTSTTTGAGATEAAVGTATLTRPGDSGGGPSIGGDEPLLAPFPARAAAVEGYVLPVSDPLEDFTPPGLPELKEPALYVFNKMDFRTWEQTPDRAPVVDIVYYLATHPGRPVSGETLRTALGSEVADPGRPTLRSNISRARRALGDGYLPDATDAGGYQLNGVSCDLTVMEELGVRAAAAERDGNTPHAIELYSQAVALIAGPPFDTEREYTWVDRENLRRYAERAATGTAQHLARLALADQPKLALWAARKGLRADPMDQAVAATALIAAKRAGRNLALRAEKATIDRMLKAHGAEPSVELEQLYRKLVDEPDE